MEKEKEVSVDSLELALKSYPNYFINIYGEASCKDGWKLSIQGKTTKDAVYLVENLYPLLKASKTSFKIGTQKLIDLNSEQSSKLLTIYVNDGVDVKSFAELVRINILNYEGAKGIDEKRKYTKYSEAIFYRNDRNENGEYIPV